MPQLSRLAAEPALEPAAVAVRLRRLWLGPIAASAELAASRLADNWTEVDLVREGPALRVIGPASGRAALDGPLGDLLRARMAEVTAGAVHRTVWRASARIRSPQRTRTSDLDVFGAEDPLLDAYDDILADLRAAIPPVTDAGARKALGVLRLVGVSRHRIWLAAPTVAARDAIGTVAGARAALVAAVQRVQQHERPLYRVIVDASYRSERRRLTTR